MVSIQLDMAEVIFPGLISNGSLLALQNPGGQCKFVTILPSLCSTYPFTVLVACYKNKSDVMCITDHNTHI